MRKCFIALLHLCSFYCYPQDLNLEWVSAIGGKKIEEANQLVSDDSGNVYVTGYFEDTVDFDPGPGQAIRYSNGASDIYVSKLGPNGQLKWLYTAGGNKPDYGVSIALDSSGDVLVCGSYWDTVNFDPSSASSQLVTRGNWDAFILKLSNRGVFNWVRSLGGVDADAAYAVSVKGVDNIYVGGIFADSIYYNPALPHAVANSNGFFDCFLIKYTGSGNVLWFRSWGGGGMDQLADIGLDQAGNIYTTGTFDSVTDLDPTIAVKAVRTKGSSDCFFQKFDRNGNLKWAKAFGGTFPESSEAIVCDNARNIYIAGTFKGSTDFDPDSILINTLTSNGSYDLFVLKVDSGGLFEWVRTIGGIGDEIAHSMSAKLNGYIVYAGKFQNSVDFDPGSGTYSVTSPGVASACVSMLDTAGDFVMLRHFGGNQGGSARSVSCDTSGNAFLAGSFSGTMDFDPDTMSVFNLTFKGSADAFVLKLSACGYVYGEDSVESCGPYTWKDSITYFEDNDTARVTFTNRHGCDSLTCLKLTVHDVNVAVQNNDPQIKALAVADSYQWLDCNNGYAALPGDTNQTFTATANGKYAVEVEQHGCKDTSDCIEIKSLGLHQPGMTEVKVFPNPFSDEITISGEGLSGSEIIIHSAIGDLVHREVLTSTDKHSLRLSVPAGIYVLSLNSDSGSRKVMLVRK